MSLVLSSIAINSVTVRGSVFNAALLGGVFQGEGFNGHAKIGMVKVGGDFVASSIAAGVDTDDAVISGGQSTAPSAIERIAILGQLRGTSSGGDHFGFVASASAP